MSLQSKYSSCFVLKAQYVILRCIIIMTFSRTSRILIKMQVTIRYCGNTITKKKFDSLSPAKEKNDTENPQMQTKTKKEKDNWIY